MCVCVCVFLVCNCLVLLFFFFLLAVPRSYDMRVVLCFKSAFLYSSSLHFILPHSSKLSDWWDEYWMHQFFSHTIAFHVDLWEIMFFLYTSLLAEVIMFVSAVSSFIWLVCKKMVVYNLSMSHLSCSTHLKFFTYIKLGEHRSVEACAYSSTVLSALFLVLWRVEYYLLVPLAH